MTGHAPQGPVAPIDSAGNTTAGEVIGNKLDTEAGDSLAARQVVPLVDQANNDWSSDVTGNKGDTVAGDSLVALNQQELAALVVIDTEVGVIDGYHDVPATDTADNNQLRDVLGSKLDRTYNGGNSVRAEVHSLEEHAHAQQECAPSFIGGGTPITVTAGAAGVLGAFSADLLALNEVAVAFDVHWVVFHALSANDNYELLLYYGAGDTLAGSAQITRAGALATGQSEKIMTVVIPANSRVRAKLATTGGGSTCDVTIKFHRY